MLSQREQNTGFDKNFRKNFKKTDKTAKLFEKKTIFISESFIEGPCLPKTAQKRCIGIVRGSTKPDGRQSRGGVFWNMTKAEKEQLKAVQEKHYRELYEKIRPTVEANIRKWYLIRTKKKRKRTCRYTISKKEAAKILVIKVD